MYKLLRMFSFYHPLSMMFEDDPNKADANNPNASGGGDGNKKASAGGGGGDKGKKQATDDSYEIVVDGEKRTVTLEEMKNLAQKASGAEKKFQEASKMRKAAEDGTRLLDLVERLKDPEHEPTELEVRELATMIGADPGELMEKLNTDDGQGGTPPKGETKMTREQFAELFGFDLAEAKATLEYSKQAQINEARKYIKNQAEIAVDKDEIFGKMKIGEGGDDRISVIKDMVAEDVFRKMQDGQPFGAELVAASVQKIRAHLSKFGTPGKPEQYPITLGLGPGQGLPSEVQSDKPIERIKSTENEAEDNFVKRAMQKGLQMLKNNPNNRR